MDLKPFKLDIDDLIKEFTESELTTLADMKRVWMSRKFSFIFEASPTTNLACFMQSLYAHSIAYMASTSVSLSHRLGGLYCLYCLHETQPFKPPFKIYLSLGELKRLKNLVTDAKEKGIGIVPALVKSMVQGNMILFGFVDINEGSVAERVTELTDIQNARVQVAQKKLFADTRIEQFMDMDLGTELDIDSLKRVSRDYAVSKQKAITEGSKVVDVNDIKHIASSDILIGDVVEQTAKNWNLQKEDFYQQTGFGHRHANKESQNDDNGVQEHQNADLALQVTEPNNETEKVHEDDDEFGMELEEILSKV